MNTDRIEKQVLLHAPLERVWRAISDSTEFGTWFGVRFDGPFAPGGRMRAVITPTAVDAEVAAMQQPHAGTPFEVTIERMEPQRLLSFRWNPYAVEPGVDYSKEPTTLVAFALQEAEGGVLLTITESGFDRIPLERRAKAFSANEQGWTMQVKLITKYLAGLPRIEPHA
ncbi:MAG TPA: SRPBCC family protein [Bryobacteraceae bacterium]|nr:SRPBCC family protein [Bryobacteraceae bacterium]